MQRVRSALAAPFRWLAVGLLGGADSLNRASAALLVAWKWLRGPDDAP